MSCTGARFFPSRLKLLPSAVTTANLRHRTATPRCQSSCQHDRFSSLETRVRTSLAKHLVADSSDCSRRCCTSMATSDFDIELAKPRINRASVKAAHLTVQAELLGQLVAAKEEARASADMARASADMARASENMARAEVKEWVIRAKDAEYLLQRRVVQLAEAKSRLSMRGVIEFIEDDLRSSDVDFGDLRRKELWRRALPLNPSLRACLVAPEAFGGRRKGVIKDGMLADDVVDLYGKLSDKIHITKSPAEYDAGSQTLLISDRDISQRDCRALLCMCNDYKFPAKLSFTDDDTAL